MGRPYLTLFLGLWVLAGSACGRKGPLELPPGREPMAVEGLTASQRGASVILEWTNPVKAVSGHPLAGLETIEVWVFDRGLPVGGRPPGSAEVEKLARPARRISKEEFEQFRKNTGNEAAVMVFAFSLDTGSAAPKSLAFSVRVLDRKKRASDFSTPAALLIRVCPSPPQAGETRVFPDFIEVSWVPPEANVDGSRPASVGGYAVYRYEGDGPQRKLTLLPADRFSFEDRDFEFGKAYIYTVRAVAAGTGGAVESGDSGALKTVPRDVFPPAAPAGLAVLAGEGLVSLSWKPATDRDLDGYRVWRKEAGSAAFVRLGAGLVRENTFTDRTAEKSISYVYAVSAVDRAANESPKSESGTVVVKGARP